MENTEFIKEFIEEATTHLEAVEVGLLKLESGSITTDTIHNIFRAVHSIKGTAGFFSLTNIVKLSHVMENLLGEIRKGSMAITNEMVEALLSANDCLKNMIGDLNNSENIDLSVHLTKMEAIMSRKDDSLIIKAQKQFQTEQTNLSMLEQEPELTSSQVTAIQQAFKRGQRIQKIYCQTSPNETAVKNEPPPDITKKITSIGQIISYFSCTSLTSQMESTIPTKSFGIFLIATVLEKSLTALALGIPEEYIVEQDIDHYRENTTNITFGEGNTPDVPLVLPIMEEVTGIHENIQQITAEETIRVPVPLLNDLLNLASEMVLGRNQLLRLLNDQRKTTQGLNTVLQNIDNITSELQEKIMQTRMQPLARVFNKFPRVIRELAKKMAKDIELQLEGMDVELDKSIIEALGDPLTHLVRNAADHGIESPEERERTGKTRAGTLTLKAYHEGGQVTIDVTDNGRGINIDKIKEKAIENRLISSVEADLMGEQELLALLFRPGFSTASQITDLSGRGVGMDVVKTNIEKLGGVMEIMTYPGQGTTTRLTLPLTLAIIPSIIVEVKGLKFALPQVNLQEMVRIKPGDYTKKIETFQDSQVFRLRGKLLPVIQLAKVLELTNAPLDTGKVIRILVIKSGSKRFGLVVDCIHDGEEILVKLLPKYLINCKCYSGVTILGDGKSAMILDPEGIAVKAGFRFIEEDHESTELALKDQKVISELQNLLLFKCSGPETFSIDLSMVARVEKINSSWIERIGDKEFIQFRNEALRVIRPENYYPVTNKESTSDKLFVIIPKLVKYPIGLLAENILDTIETNIHFNQEDFNTKGLVGSAILNKRISLIINLYELYEMVAPEHYHKDASPFHAIEDKVILVAEDTHFFAKVEKQYLEQAGYQVLTAVNGRQAWEILQETSIDVLVSDIEMPVMNGYELIKRVRADSKLSSLPTIAVTSKTDQRSINKGIEAGFDFYEIKLDKEKLLEKVALALQKGTY